MRLKTQIVCVVFALACGRKASLPPMATYADTPHVSLDCLRHSFFGLYFLTLAHAAVELAEDVVTRSRAVNLEGLSLYRAGRYSEVRDLATKRLEQEGDHRVCRTVVGSRN